MLSKKTIVILGAGASKEFGLPIGNQLKDTISNDLNIRFREGYKKISGSDAIYWSLDHHAKKENVDVNFLISAGLRIVESLPHFNSIDALLEYYSEDRAMSMVGRLAIINAIIAAERKSTLFVKQHERTINFKESNTWLDKLFRTIFSDCKRGQESSILENVIFISFNYDRTIEHYLKYAFSNLTKDYDDLSIINKINIIHPYGKIAPLDWQGGPLSVPFGADLRPQTLLNLETNIKTYTQRDHDKEFLMNIHSAINSSHTILLLGLAFHEQNLSLIAPKEIQKSKRIYATCYGVHEENRSKVRTRIVRHLQSKPTTANEVTIADCTCSDFIDRFSMHL